MRALTLDEKITLKGILAAWGYTPTPKLTMANWCCYATVVQGRVTPRWGVKPRRMAGSTPRAIAYVNKW